MQVHLGESGKSDKYFLSPIFVQAEDHPRSGPLKHEV